MVDIDTNIIADAVDLDMLADEVERILANFENRPSQRARIRRQVVKKHFPRGTKKSVLLKVENSIDRELFRRLGERAQLLSRQRVIAATTKGSRPGFAWTINTLSRRDLAAGEGVQLRNDESVA